MASVEVRGAGLAEARAFLASLEAASGVPPVDEDEQRRLSDVEPIRDRDWSWGGHLALVDEVPVAYAGTRLPAVLPSDPTACVARVDLALDRSHPDASDALVAALDDAREHAQRRAAASGEGGTPATEVLQGQVKGPVQAWLRGATEHDLAAAGRAGFALSKRLHVMAVPLTTPLVDSPDAATPDVALPEGLRIRSFDAASPEDADAVVALLAAAYPGSEGGWDAAGFAVRRATDWFRAEDLLLLEDVGDVEKVRDVGDVGDVEGVAGDGGEGGPVAAAPRLLGVHWTKRRGEGVGEVHNLALGPAARGRGLGGLLLDAGLAHLAQAGCLEVILWVDADNAPALRLYRSRGFAPRWDDVALVG